MVSVTSPRRVWIAWSRRQIELEPGLTRHGLHAEDGAAAGQGGCRGGDGRRAETRPGVTASVGHAREARVARNHGAGTAIGADQVVPIRNPPRDGRRRGPRRPVAALVAEL